MNIERIKPLQDNVLLQFAAHKDPHSDCYSPGGILLPQQARDPRQGQAIEAIVVAAGPGHYADEWQGYEKGTAAVGSKRFIPLDPAIVPGARVLCSALALGADRLFSDERSEYRMVRASVIEAVIEDG